MWVAELIFGESQWSSLGFPWESRAWSDPSGTRQPDTPQGQHGRNDGRERFRVERETRKWYPGRGEEKGDSAEGDAEKSIFSFVSSSQEMLPPFLLPADTVDLIPLSRKRLSAQLPGVIRSMTLGSQALQCSCAAPLGLSYSPGASGSQEGNLEDAHFRTERAGT